MLNTYLKRMFMTTKARMHGKSKDCKVDVRQLVVESGVITARVSIYGNRNDGSTHVEKARLQCDGSVNA
jgi:hypothetical protein